MGGAGHIAEESVLALTRQKWSEGWATKELKRAITVVAAESKFPHDNCRQSHAEVGNGNAAIDLYHFSEDSKMRLGVKWYSCEKCREIQITCVSCWMGMWHP